MFRRKKPIPPPLEPNFNQDMMLPFMLIDYPRVLLDWLTKREEIPEDERALIYSLLNSYSGILAEWIVHNYGFNGLMVANVKTQQVAHEFYKALGEVQSEHETSLFRFWEESMGDDD